MNEVAVIIPAWNEFRPTRGGLGEILQQLQSRPYSVIVVDDGSVDQTGVVARQYATVLRHPINRGQGAALVTGMEYALRHGAEILVHFDGDGQMMVDDIEKMVQPLLDDPALDITLGSRFLGHSDVPWVKKYLLQTPALWFQRLTTGLPLTDVHNGFRAIRARAARLLTIQQDGMAHASEITMEISKHKLRWQEVPVTIVYREFGQGFSGGLKILRDLIIRRLIK